MNIEKIKHAITKLSPNELARFHVWLKEYESNIQVSEVKDPRQIRETLKRLRGSLKGTGVLESLMEERRKERLL